MTEGYPGVVIAIVLVIGIPLAFYRPYMGFLFAVLLLTAGNFQMFNKTRLVGLGPYLNLHDACVLVALAAFLLDKTAGGKAVRVPQIVALMLFAVVIAGAQSAWRFGWSYETMSWSRMVLDFPIAFLLGANLVDSTDRARRLVGVLLIAALLAAIQHVLFVANIWATRSLTIKTYNVMRTIGYWTGCLPSAFLLAGVIWKSPKGLVRKGLWLGAGVLLVATVFLNQTRSLWLATVCALPVLMVALRGTNWIRISSRLLVGGAVVVLLLGILCQRLVPGLDIGTVAGQRLASLVSSDALAKGTGGRERAFQVEMDNWVHGTLLFGRGLCFFQVIHNPETESGGIAFGHLGYVTYLSQLGLVGLLVYAVLLPLLVFRNGLWLWRYGQEPVVRFLGGLGTASIVCLSLMFVMSSHFLGSTYFAPGVLYGGMWALVEQDKAGACCLDTSERGPAELHGGGNPT